MDEKRRKEQIRRQKQKEKEERKARRLSERKTGTGAESPGTDPDLEGLVPGPQPGQILEID